MNPKIQEIILKMQKGERLYKYTGKLPPLVMLENSEEKIPNRLLDRLFEKAIIKVDDASAFETWYTLTDTGKAFKF